MNWGVNHFTSELAYMRSQGTCKSLSHVETAQSRGCTVIGRSDLKLVAQ